MPPLLFDPEPLLPRLELPGSVPVASFDEPSPELSRLGPALPLEELPAPREEGGATPNADAVLLSKVPVTVMF